MASNNEGVAVLAFGTTTITGYIVESVRETTGSETVQIMDEDGQIVVDINSFGINTQVDLSVVPKSGTSVPSVGDVLTYTSKTHGSQKITVLEIEPNSANNDVTRWNIRGHRHPDITLS